MIHIGIDFADGLHALWIGHYCPVCDWFLSVLALGQGRQNLSAGVGMAGITVIGSLPFALDDGGAGGADLNIYAGPEFSRGTAETGKSV